jgi:hypothetical protein
MKNETLIPIVCDNLQGDHCSQSILDMDEGSEVFLLSTTSGGLRSGKLPSEEPSIPMYSTSSESHQFSLASRMPEGETLDSISVSEEDSQSGPPMASILCDSLSASSQDSHGHGKQ